jgi:uncharacterized membrane protein YbaN (DUF454 family)
MTGICRTSLGLHLKGTTVRLISAMFSGIKKILQNHLLVILGWLFVVLGVIGAMLPILPTTPFLIVALALFSKSSPRFHQMLLNNAWFGPNLKQWEEKKTLSRKTKYKASFLIIITFTVSIAIFDDTIQLQLLLVGIAIVLLFFIWRIKEQE